MVEIAVQVPDEIALALGGTASLRARRVLEDAAIEGYRAGRLSQRQLGGALGLDYWQSERFLADHRVPLSYSLADLEADRGTLDEILGRP